MRLYFTSVLLFIFSISFAQDRLIRKSVEAYHFKKYKDVVKYLNKVPYSKLSQLHREMRATSMLNIHDYDKALHAFDNLDLNLATNDSVYLYYAQVLEYNGQYDKALVYYQKFNLDHPKDQMTLAHIQSCTELNKMKNWGRKALVSPFPHNTEENDFVGFIMDSSLFFVSGGYNHSIKKYHWDGQHFLNFYYASNQNGESLVKPIHGALRSSLHEGPGFYDANTKTLYFTRNAHVHSENKNGESISNLKIYSSEYKNNHWTSVVELPFNDEKYSTGHPTGVNGGNYLIFSSNQSGGKGKADLYIVYRNIDGNWGEGNLLLGGVNTEGQELFPYLANDTTLYFASDGHFGLGGLDIYKAKIDNGVVSGIQNLGSSINSKSDDFGLVFTNYEQTEGYFSSDRKNGLGTTDIYKFKWKTEVETQSDVLIDFSGTILEAEGGKPIGQVRVETEIDDQVYVDTSDTNGNFAMQLPKREKYAFTFYKEGFLTNTQTLFPKEEIRTSMESSSKGHVLNLPNIYYEYDKEFITAQAKPILEALISIMRLNPSLQIEISSHADARGSDAYNRDLSLRRAKSVIDFLVKNNISQDRLSVKYYGESKLVNNCEDDKDCLEELHSRNRRTEFKIVGF